MALYSCFCPDWTCTAGLVDSAAAATASLHYMLQLLTQARACWCTVCASMPLCLQLGGSAALRLPHQPAVQAQSSACAACTALQEVMQAAAPRALPATSLHCVLDLASVCWARPEAPFTGISWNSRQ